MSRALTAENPAERTDHAVSDLTGYLTAPPASLCSTCIAPHVLSPFSSLVMYSALSSFPGRFRTFCVWHVRLDAAVKNTQNLENPTSTGRPFDTVGTPRKRKVPNLINKAACFRTRDGGVDKR